MACFPEQLQKGAKASFRPGPACGDSRLPQGFLLAHSPTAPTRNQNEPKLLFDLRAAIQGCLKPSFWHVSPNSSKKEPNHLRPATCRRLLPSLYLTFFPGYLQKASACFSIMLPSPRLVLNNAGFLRSDSHPASASQHVADDVITSCICGKQSTCLSAQMRHTPAYTTHARPGFLTGSWAHAAAVGKRVLTQLHIDFF